VSIQPQRVLLIEDNQGDADLVRLRLVESNSESGVSYEVSCADRLSTGLAALDEERPAVVLLDLYLPDSQGADTFRKVLNKTEGVPVVVLSARDDQELAISAVHQGVQDYLVKGAFDSKHLGRVLRYAIERQALLTTLDMSRKQELEFKDQFLSNVSHELRTPLSSIHQFVTILLDDLAGPISGEQREHLDVVLRSVNQLQSMIGDLLEATSAESGKMRIEPRCFAIGDVVQQAVAMMEATARSKEIDLEASLDTRPLLVFADPDRILQVLINLIDNALKFTPPRGLVTVKAFLVEADSAFVYISVKDSGSGIEPETKPRIFERMYQDPNGTGASRKGLGIGLYIAQELVRLQGGRIWVESEVGRGSIFNFTLRRFSLSKLLFPIIADQGALPPSLTLVTVDVTSPWTYAMGEWKQMRARCLELLQSCIMPAKDLVLPYGEISGSDKTFWIVASADQSGAGILEQRIRGRLERIEEARAGVTFTVSTTPMQLPSADPDKPLAKLVQEVADVISKMVGIDTRKQSPS
jgi:signal transduction histidine kinase